MRNITLNSAAGNNASENKKYRSWWEQYREQVNDEAKHSPSGLGLASSWGSVRFDYGSFYFGSAYYHSSYHDYYRSEYHGSAYHGSSAEICDGKLSSGCSKGSTTGVDVFDVTNLGIGLRLI